MTRFTKSISHVSRPEEFSTIAAPANIRFTKISFVVLAIVKNVKKTLHHILFAIKNMNIGMHGILEPEPNENMLAVNWIHEIAMYVI